MEDAASDAVQKLHPALIKFLNRCTCLCRVQPGRAYEYAGGGGFGGGGGSNQKGTSWYGDRKCLRGWTKGGDYRRRLEERPEASLEPLDPSEGWTRGER